MTRTDLIADLADEIACGEFKKKPYNTAFFIDAPRDAGRITNDDIAVLLCMNEFSDAHIETQERVQDILRAEAVEFFTNDERGQLHIDDLMAEQRREEAADAAYERAA